MAEKGETPSDQVSLPPNYASSETFTDSPPPAYRVPGTAAVKIAKLVCMTVFFLTVLLCLFFLGHKYLHNQSMKQTQEYEKLHFDEISQLGETAPLISKAGFTNLDLNNNVIEEFVEAQKKQKAEGHNNNEQDSAIVEDALAEDEEVKNEVEEIQNSLKEGDKEVQLPSLDLMLGKRPIMGAGNIKCRVQKRQQKIGEHMITQAVIVKCDDEEGEEEESTKMRPFGPPLSLLGNIMKVLASKASRSRQEEPKIKKLELRPMPLPSPRPSEMMGMNGPFRPMPGPFNGPPRKVVHFIPLNRINGPRPFGPPMDGPPPFLERQRGPIPHFRKGFMKMIPLKNFEDPRLGPISDTNEILPPFFTPRRESELNQPRGFLNFIPLRRIVEGPRPEPFSEQNEIPPQIFNPQMGPSPFLRPLKVMRESFNPMHESGHQMPPFHMMGDNEGPMPGPFPFPPRNRPVKIIRFIKRGNEMDEFPEMMDRPFAPPNPIMRIIPREARRIIHIRREPMNGDMPFDMGPMPIRGAFPFPRGALPMEPMVDESNINSLPVPVAKPRAIPSPMALPGLKLLRIPLEPIADMGPMPEMKISTHMEIRQPPPHFPMEGPRQFPMEEHHQFPMEEHHQFHMQEPPQFRMQEHPQFPMQEPPQFPMQEPQQFPMQGPSQFPMQGPSQFPMQGPSQFPIQDLPQFPMQEPPQFPMQEPPQFPMQGPSHFPMEEPLLFPPQEIFPQEEYEREAEEFGPPRIHTLIEAAPPPYVEEEQQQQPHILPPPFFPEESHRQPLHFPPGFMAQPPPPPPSGYDAEGRFSPMAEIDPDAEMIEGDGQVDFLPHEFVPEEFDGNYGESRVFQV